MYVKGSSFDFELLPFLGVEYMKKVTLFFCDIWGTFDSKNHLNVNCEEIKRFVDNLNQLMQYNETNQVIFSFVTTENLNTVRFMETQLRTYINDNIFIGNHIYYDGINIVNKPHDIIMYIKELESQYNIDNNIYYADDSEFFHWLLLELKDYCNLEYQIHSIIPQHNGLSDVNFIIESLLEKSKRYKKEVL